jgi:peptide/nickel transport system substrate-binding protein
MRRLRAMVLAGALLGCTGPVGDVRVPPVAPLLESPTPSRQRLSPAGTIVLALPAAPARLDAPPATHAPTTDLESAEQMVAHLLHARLVGVDDQGEPFADLVERVPTIENGGARWLGEGDARQLESTFTLRVGAPVKADDVVAAWRAALDARPPEIATERRYERVEARDPSTVVMTLFSERSARAAAAREPNRHGFLRDQRGPVVDALYYMGLPSVWLGPGPFALRERRPDGALLLDARPDYHRGAPKLQAIVLRPIDAAPALAQLAGGEIDVLPLERPTGALAGAVRGLRGVRVGVAPGPAAEVIEVNLARPGVRDRAVREALLRALDRRALAEVAVGARLADELLADDPVARRHPPDVVAARQLLRAAGFAIGNDGVAARGVERPILRLVTTDDQRRRDTAALIREQLARIDVDVQVEPHPPARLFDRRSGPLATGDYDLALVGTAAGLDPLGELAERHAGASAGLDRLLARAPVVLARDERRQLRAEVDAQLLEELPAVPLFTYPRLVATSPELGGVKPPRVAAPVTWNAHEWSL